MNSVNIIGRCASDVEKFWVESCKSWVVKFALAFDNRTRKTDGRKDTFYIECEAWKEVAERIYDNIKKGDKMGISGHLEQRKYVRKNGENASTIILVVSTIEFLSPKTKTPVDEPKETVEKKSEDEEIRDDELPF